MESVKSTIYSVSATANLDPTFCHYNENYYFSVADTFYFFIPVNSYTFFASLPLFQPTREPKQKD